MKTTWWIGPRRTAGAACLLALGLAACSSLKPVDGDLPCLETGYAISHRTYACTGDPDLARERFERFEERYTCVEVEFAPIEEPNAFLMDAEDIPGNWFHCAFAVGELACELVLEYGDDLDLWLTASPVCDRVVR